MAATAILNYYLVTLDHPRSLLVDRKSYIKFCVHQAGTFSRYQDLKILQIYIKMPILTLKHSRFGGFNP